MTLECSFCIRHRQRGLAIAATAVYSGQVRTTPRGSQKRKGVRPFPPADNCASRTQGKTDNKQEMLDACCFFHLTVFCSGICVSADGHLCNGGGAFSQVPSAQALLALGNPTVQFQNGLSPGRPHPACYYRYYRRWSLRPSTGPKSPIQTFRDSHSQCTILASPSADQPFGVVSPCL